MNEEQTITQLPKNWKWVTLDDVCNKIGDIDHKMPKQIESGYPYVSTKDFTDNLKISFDRAKYISKEDFLLLSKKIKPEKGDIIFPRYGTIGKNILIDFDKEFLVSYSCAIVKPNTGLVIPKYIYLYSLSPRVGKEIEKYVVETTQANIGIASIKRFVFPLPPIDEQQQVISKIEELFSEIDKGIEEIKTAQQQLKVYRQAVLKWGFEGKLTNEDVSQDELPKEWKWKTLKDITIKRSVKALPKDFPEAKFIGMDCIEPHTLKPNFLYDFKEFKSSGNTFEENDVLYGRMRPYLNKVYRAEFNGTCSGEFIILRCKDFNPDLLKYILHSKGFVSFANYKTAGDRPRISYDEIGEYPIALAPLEEQQQIVQEIESRLSVCDKIEETITNSLKQAEALRQSILKKAFEGKLI